MDSVKHRRTECVPRRLAEDEAYRNSEKNHDPVNASVNHGRAVGRVIWAVLKDDAEPFKRYIENEGVKGFLSDADFRTTCRESA